MTMRLSLYAAALLAALISFPATTQALNAAAEGVETTRQRGDDLSRAITKVTGVSIAPTAGMAVLGAWKYLITPPAARDALPWYDQPWFWGTLLTLLALQWIGHRVPVVRTLAKAIKVKEDQLAAVVSILVLANECGLITRSWGGSTLSALHASTRAGLLAVAMPQGINAAYLVGFLGATIIGGTVWLAAHTVYVLSLLAPFQLIEWILKCVRLVPLTLLVVSSAVSPVAGLVLSLALFVAATLVAGWSFRLMVFGSVFTSDILLIRWIRDFLHEEALRAFSSRGLPGVPVRTYGALRANGREVWFVYRELPFLSSRSVPVSGELVAGTGLISPTVLQRETGRHTQLFRLPPRYRAVPHKVASALGGLPTVETSFTSSLKEALVWLREQFRPRGRSVTWEASQERR